MSNKKYKLTGQLQAVYKVLFTLLLLILSFIALYKLFQKDFEGIIVLCIWLIILAIIVFRIIKTVDIRFDDKKVYIKRGVIKTKKHEYRLDQIEKIQTSFTGYFTTISLYDELNQEKKYSCFNTTVSALKNNRTDLLKLNKIIIKTSNPDSDTVEILRNKVRAFKEIF